MHIQIQLGTYRTRSRRVVQVTKSFEVNDAPQPGMAPERRLVWRGTLMMADGKTVSSAHDWEPDGRLRTPQGIATDYDLVELIMAAPPAPPVPEPVAPPTEDLGDFVDVLADYHLSGETTFDTLNRVLAERDHARTVLAKLASVKRKNETDADCLDRLIAESQLAAAEKPGKRTVTV